MQREKVISRFWIKATGFKTLCRQQQHKLTVSIHMNFSYSCSHQPSLTVPTDLERCLNSLYNISLSQQSHTLSHGSNFKHFFLMGFVNVTCDKLQFQQNLQLNDQMPFGWTKFMLVLFPLSLIVLHKISIQDSYHAIKMFTRVYLVSELLVILPLCP